MSYLYESHMGGIYFSETELDYDDLYCETCGDSDFLLGRVETFEDAWNLLRDDIDFCGSGGWNLGYVFPKLVSEFSDDERLAGISSETDSEGESVLDQFEILKLVEKALGGKPRVFEYEYEDERGFLLADDETEAREKSRVRICPRTWDENAPPEAKVTETTLDEAKEKYLKGN